jgi:hypothetical protein
MLPFFFYELLNIEEKWIMTESYLIYDDVTCEYIFAKVTMVQERRWNIMKRKKDKVSICPMCHCMTKDVYETCSNFVYCGKCQELKREAEWHPLTH